MFMLVMEPVTLLAKALPLGAPPMPMPTTVPVVVVVADPVVPAPVPTLVM